MGAAELRPHANTWGAPPGSNRGGGPKTEKGLIACRDAAQKHGIYTMLQGGPIPGCNVCPLNQRCPDYEKDGSCVQALAEVDRIATETMREPFLTPAAHHVTREYAHWIVAARIVDKHIQVGGLVTGGMVDGVLEPYRPAPLFAVRAEISRMIVNIAKELGLTPASASRAKLGVVGDDQSQLMLAFADFIHDREREQEAEVVEGEWEREGQADDRETTG
jgi:phage terminase small subunit